MRRTITITFSLRCGRFVFNLECLRFLGSPPKYTLCMNRPLTKQSLLRSPPSRRPKSSPCQTTTMWHSLSACAFPCYLRLLFWSFQGVPNVAQAFSLCRPNQAPCPKGMHLADTYHTKPTSDSTPRPSPPRSHLGSPPSQRPRSSQAS